MTATVNDLLSLPSMRLRRGGMRVGGIGRAASIRGSQLRGGTGNNASAAYLKWACCCALAACDVGAIVGSVAHITCCIQRLLSGHTSFQVTHIVLSVAVPAMLFELGCQRRKQEVPMHRLQDHTATVKALAWCPFKSKVLASGGGAGDHHIRCLLYTSPSPRDRTRSRMPSSA